MSVGSAPDRSRAPGEKHAAAGRLGAAGGQEAPPPTEPNHRKRVSPPSSASSPIYPNRTAAPFCRLRLWSSFAFAAGSLVLQPAALAKALWIWSYSARHLV